MLHLPELPDSLYWIHSHKVPDEDEEILVFLLFFSISENMEERRLQLVWRQGMGGGRE